MTADMTWPNPTSTYQLRGHLRDNHAHDQTGAAWHELDQVHRHLHRGGADHDHEASR